MPVARLDRIPDVSVKVNEADRSDLMGVIHAALNVALDLNDKDFSASLGMEEFSGRALNVAGLAALQSVNSLLSATSARCTLDSPPEEFELVTKGGRLIYRCYHSPAHEFDLQGNPVA